MKCSNFTYKNKVNKCSTVTFYGIDRWASKKLVHEVKWNVSIDIDAIDLNTFTAVFMEPAL